MSARRQAATAGWDNVELAPVVLIKGPEAVLADRAVARLTAQARDTDPDTEITHVQAAAYAPGQLTVLTSPSLFGERRLIIVEGAEHMNDAFLTDMLAYAKAPQDECWVIIRHGGGQRGAKLVKALTGTYPCVACDQIKSDADKARFVSSDFARARRRIANDAVVALVEAVGSDVAELASASAQLIADTEGTVSVDVVRRYYGHRVEATGFAVADAVIAGRSATALALLRHAVDTGTSPVPIVAALAMKLRTMARVGGARNMRAKDLGLAPWQVERARRDLRGWTPEALGAAIMAVAAADEGVKGGAKDPIYAVEKAILTIGRARASARRR
ncbi:MAG: DNA polymerase III subunit delta [Bowdeniella nasicola]|nr:DNA polymerase III subunit delta [Bowdeniella nasicola]